MEVSKNKVVTLTYSLKLDDDKIVDSATVEQPFAFIHGIGQTLPAFDEALAGKKPGDEFSFSLTSENAYGEYLPGYVHSIPKSAFEEAPEGTIEVGNTVPMQDQNGNALMGVIQEVTDAEVKMDFNHPLAGQNLNFTGKILELREATRAELDHGHVHGPGGHQH